MTKPKEISKPMRFAEAAGKDAMASLMARVPSDAATIYSALHAAIDGKVRMRIPVQPDDTDLVLMKAVEEAIASREKIARLRAAVGKANELLGANGCDCECDHHYEDHDDDCERCLACRIDAALEGAKGES